MSMDTNVVSRDMLDRLDNIMLCYKCMNNTISFTINNMLFFLTSTTIYRDEYYTSLLPSTPMLIRYVLVGRRLNHKIALLVGR